MIFIDRCAFCAQMAQSVRKFACDQRGAVTIDWVILTAGIVVTAIAVANVFRVEEPTLRCTMINDDPNNPVVIFDFTDGSFMGRLIYGVRWKAKMHDIALFGGQLELPPECQ